MFGFGQRRKEQDLEKLTDLWMRASLILVDTEEVKANDEKFKIVLAYFFGTTDMGGRNSGLSQDVIMKTFLRCIARHLNLSTPEEIKRAYQTVYSISEDMEYVKIMWTGIETLDRWMQTKDHGAPAMLGCLLIGK